MRFKNGLLVMGVLLSVMVSTPAWATYWTGAAGDGNWSTAANWFEEHVPSSGEDAYIRTGDTVTLSSAATPGALFLGYGSNFRMVGGTLNSVYEYLGYFGASSRFIQSAGEHTVSRIMSLGFYDLGTGYYDLLAGSLNADAEIIGYAGHGIFEQENGIHTIAKALTIAGYSSGVGDYYLRGGTLKAYNVIVGDSGTGTFTQTGKESHNIVEGTLTVGEDSGSAGKYELKGGTLTAQYEHIGFNGKGTFTQSDGTTNTISAGGHMLIGVGQDAKYNLHGGTLNGPHNSASERGIEIGYNAVGTFNHDGGICNSSVTLGSSVSGSGVYALSDTAELHTYYENIGGFGQGHFIQMGGINTVDWNMHLGFNQGSTGLYDLGGAESVLKVAINEYIGLEGYGEFTQIGGKHEVGNNLYIGKSSTGEGEYLLSNGELIVGNHMIVGDYGEARVTQEGGTGIINGWGLVLGYSFSGKDEYNLYTLKGGQLTAQREQIGRYGRGRFNLNGGMNTIVKDLSLATKASGKGEYNLNNGTLNAGNEYIGEYGYGEFNHKNGNNIVGGFLVLGEMDGSRGVYTLDSQNPLVSVSAGDEIEVGEYGYGRFDQFTGSVTTRSLTVGLMSVGIGRYNLRNGTLTQSGRGFLSRDVMLSASVHGGDMYDALLAEDYIYEIAHGTARNWDTLDEIRDFLIPQYSESNVNDVLNAIASSNTSLTSFVGLFGNGTFDQTGGGHTINGGLHIGYGADSTGLYKLSSGELHAVSEYIGGQGLGTFEHINGLNTVSENLFVRSNGQYNLNNGQLYAASEYIGEAGSGEFNHTAGLNAVSGGLFVRANGQYDLDGGVLNADSEYVGDIGVGVFNHLGGANTVSSYLVIGKEKGSDGLYNFTPTDPSMLLPVGKEIVVGESGTGTFMHESGEVDTASLALGLRNGGDGTYELMDGTLVQTGAYLISKDIMKNTDFDGEDMFNTLLGGGYIYALDDGKALYAGTWDDLQDILSASYTEAAAAGVVHMLKVYEDESYAGIVGVAGEGKFNQYGGDNTLDGALRIAYLEGSKGTYNLHDGLLTANAMYVGGEGEGVFNQYSGDVILNEYVSVHADGKYNLMGGSLEAVAAYIRGGFHQSGGSATFGSVHVNDGQYTISDGTLHAQQEYIVDRFRQTGGLNRVTHDLNIASEGEYAYLGGVLKTETIVNDGIFTIQGGTEEYPRVITGDITNNGIFKTTDAVLNLNGTFQNNGAYISDPSVNQFNDLVINGNGYLVGGAGDEFRISGNLVINGINAGLWDTKGALLAFDTGVDGSHELEVNTDMNGKFAWSDFTLSSGNVVSFMGTVENPFYFKNINLASGFDQLVGVKSTIYYQTLSVGGQAMDNTKWYALAGGGSLAPWSDIPLDPIVTPEPMSCVLFVIGGSAMALARRRMMVNG